MFFYGKEVITRRTVALATSIKFCNNPDMSILCVTVAAVVGNVFAVCILRFAKSLRK